MQNFCFYLFLTFFINEIAIAGNCNGKPRITCSKTTFLFDRNCAGKPRIIFLIRTRSQLLEAWKKSLVGSGVNRFASTIQARNSAENDFIEELDDKMFTSMNELQSNHVCSSEFCFDNFGSLSYSAIVDWLFLIGESFELSDHTIHASVLVINRLFQSVNKDKIESLVNSISQSEYKFVILACFSIVTKFEYEESEKHLLVSKLLDAAQLENIKSTAFRNLEFECFKILDFDIGAVPPIDFIEYFLTKKEILDDCQNDMMSKTIYLERLKKWASFLCNITVRERSFLRYKPCELAAAILYTSCQLCDVKPEWEPKYRKLTGVEEDKVEQIFRHIWEYYSENYP